ncbi:MAG: SIMPL domain-containing protein [Bacteroidales bacterium]|nr:SIMPL domain-containing protein [Bacteroidales bacterium]
MKKTILVIAIIAISMVEIFAQVRGNASFTSFTSPQYATVLPAKPTNTYAVFNNDINVRIKGMVNVKADSYVAIFGLTQTGKTAAEVNELMDKRIKSITNDLSSNKNISIYVDMLSFVPVYEYDIVKKLFSKDTYNEIPKGFELKKNIHIRYKNPNFLNPIISSCSKAEVYNLVRVDLFSDSLEQMKEQLMEKASKILKQRLKHKADILEIDYADYKRQMDEGFKVVYPIEMYQQYQAYVNNKLTNTKYDANSSHTKKTTTHYYKPVVDKEFDFVINPRIFEPVIQIMYELKIRAYLKPKPTVKKEEPIIKTKTIVKKKVILIMADGKLKEIDI